MRRGPRVLLPTGNTETGESSVTACRLQARLSDRTEKSSSKGKTTNRLFSGKRVPSEPHGGATDLLPREPEGSAEEGAQGELL